MKPGRDYLFLPLLTTTTITWEVWTLPISSLAIIVPSSGLPTIGTVYFIGFWIHLSLIPIVYSRLSIPTTRVEVSTTSSVNGSPISVSILASESLSLWMIVLSHQHRFTLLSISKNNTLHSERPVRETHRTPERQSRFRTQQAYHTTHQMQPGAAPNTQDAPDAAHNPQDALDAVPNTQDAI